MHHDVVVLEDPAAVAATAADLVAEQVRAAVAAHGTFTMAVSGGRSPAAMFEHLGDEDLPWSSVSIWQVDERIAPPGDPDRNLVGLQHALGTRPVTLHPMDVEALVGDGPGGATRDPERIAEVCRQEAASLPARFDLIHLGLGPDGHTASLVPDDDVLHVTDADVAVTSTAYQGRRRMTMTYPTLGRTGQLLWLVTGASKAEALAGMLRGDPDLPASRVVAPRSVVVTDRAAHP